MPRRSRRLPLAAGLLLDVGGTVFGVYVLTWISQPFPLNLLALFVAWNALEVFPHTMTHFLVGRSLGIRFTHFDIAPSAIRKLRLPVLPKLAARIPVLGIRLAPHSLMKISPGRGAVMFASGAVASILLPYTVVWYAFVYAGTTYGGLLFALSLAATSFTLYFSPKTGDFARARAQLQRARPRSSAG